MDTSQIATICAQLIAFLIPGFALAYRIYDQIIGDLNEVFAVLFAMSMVALGVSGLFLGIAISPVLTAVNPEINAPLFISTVCLTISMTLFLMMSAYIGYCLLAKLYHQQTRIEERKGLH